MPRLILVLGLFLTMYLTSSKSSSESTLAVPPDNKKSFKTSGFLIGPFQIHQAIMDMNVSIQPTPLKLMLIMMMEAKKQNILEHG